MSQNPVKILAAIFACDRTGTKFKLLGMGDHA